MYVVDVYVEPKQAGVCYGQGCVTGRGRKGCFWLLWHKPLVPWPHLGLSIVPHQLGELLEQVGVPGQDAGPHQVPDGRQALPQALQPQGTGCKSRELRCSPCPGTRLQQSWRGLPGLRTRRTKAAVSLSGTQEPKRVSVHRAGAKINSSFQTSYQDPENHLPWEKSKNHGGSVPQEHSEPFIPPCHGGVFISYLGSCSSGSPSAPWSGHTQQERPRPAADRPAGAQQLRDWAGMGLPG